MQTIQIQMSDYSISGKHRTSFPYRGYFVLSICWLVFVLGGCATTTMQTESSLEKPVKVLVLQSPMASDTKRLQKVLAPQVKHALSVSDVPISQGIQHAQDYALENIKLDLAKHSKIIVVVPTMEGKPFFDKVRSQSLEAPISQSEADRIRRLTGADALLKFNITDYGLTPRAWKSGYITFEVVTTLGFAAIIAYAGTTVAKAAAGAYLVQETAEETAEAYAGFWGVNKIYRPVRLKAELVQLNPVKILWKARDTGLSKTRISRLTRKIGKSELDLQLNQSTDDAVNSIVTALSDYLNETKFVKNEH